MNDATLQTTALPASAVAAPKPAGQARLIAACSIGNALEMYDFTVYSFFALMIGKLFFRQTARTARCCSRWRRSASAL